MLLTSIPHAETHAENDGNNPDLSNFSLGANALKYQTDLSLSFALALIIIS